MIVYRLCKSVYSQDLSGRGAERVGGRWNSKGVPMVYTCSSRALSMAEVAVHLPMTNIPLDYDMVEIEIPDWVKLDIVDEKKLPVDWNALAFSKRTMDLGDHFVQLAEFLVLKVPSVVVEGDFNYLLNPNHKDFNVISIHRVSLFRFDSRLFWR